MRARLASTANALLARRAYKVPIHRSVPKIAQSVSAVRNVTGLPKRPHQPVPPIPLPEFVPEPSKGTPVHVKAYFIARSIDVVDLRCKMYQSSKHEVQPKSVTIYLNENLNQYISVFDYGSVVFFNVPEESHADHLKMIRTLAKQAVPEAFQHNESYKLLIHENLEMPSVIHAEHLNIRCLDNSNITIVSTLMAQTVAMDYFAATVDRMLEEFSRINMALETTGDIKSMREEDLYRLIASNSGVFTNVLWKLGIFEGTDVAWERADYSVTWDCE